MESPSPARKPEVFFRLFLKLLKEGLSLRCLTPLGLLLRAARPPAVPLEMPREVDAADLGEDCPFFSPPARGWLFDAGRIRQHGLYLMFGQ